MIGKSYHSASSGRQLNTLVQIGTGQTTKKVNKRERTVYGVGTDLCNVEAIKRRTKKKIITQKLILALIDIAERKGELERKNGFWNTYYCQSKVIGFAGKIYGNYCKNRICTLCSGIRKAEIINKYLPIIQNWEDPHFTTLTVKSVSARHMGKRIVDIQRALKIIVERYKKKHQRGSGTKLVGIRSLECNFNPVAKTYNPHLHIIVQTKEMAETLESEWLKLWTEKYTYRKAQKTRRIIDKEKDLIEIVKYGTKIFTDPMMKKGKNRAVSPIIYMSAIYNILTAFQGHRIFDRFGFNLPKPVKARESTSMKLTQYEELEFDSKLQNWIDKETERAISGYKLPPQLGAILESNVNLYIE